MTWQNFIINYAWALSILFPLTVGATMALYDWLASKMPKNVQAFLAQHETQVRSIVTTVVTAIEQRIPTAQNDNKKTKAMNMINQIMADMKIPVRSIAWIDGLVEEAVSLLPDTYDHTGEAATAAIANQGNTSYPTNPLFPAQAKPPRVNPLNDMPTVTAADPPYQQTAPMAPVAAPLGNPGLPDAL